MRLTGFSASLVVAACLCTATSASYTCQNITLFKNIAETTTYAVTTSQLIAANETTGAPEHCYFQALIGGRIRSWFRFPTEKVWNSRFAQYGCGGGCGYNPIESGFEDPLKKGFAISSTDMGNPENGWTAFRNNMQMKIDWGYLATHLTAVASKQLIKSYYGMAPEYSYHIGSSTGGRQGLVEAQRYPGEFDGVFAIAPAYNETGITTYQIVWNSASVVANDSSLTPLISANDTKVINAAFLDACDEMDGLKDGIISYPRLCQIDLTELECGRNATMDCLTPEAIQAAQKLYSGPVNSRGVHLTLEGVLPGSELGWGGQYISDVDGEPSGYYTFGTDYLSCYQFEEDPAVPIEARMFSMDTPISATAYVENIEYGGNADLAKFKQLGGKMIITQGLADFSVAPWYAKDYYERVVVAAGGREMADEFIRFYEMPGVFHVNGGPGADTYDMLAYITDWVEKGVAPYSIIASHFDEHGNIEFQRPLFPYPLLPFFNGGDPKSASSFVPRNASSI